MTKTKTIVILSPDSWGTMKVSKMHFATELALQGHRVFFVNPPQKKKKGETYAPIQVDNNVTVIFLKEHRLRLFAREKAMIFHRYLERKFVRSIKKYVGEIDEVWSFNPLVFTEFRSFRARKKLLFVYDLFKTRSLRIAAMNCDGIISVAHHILQKLAVPEKPSMFIQHGLAPAFENAALAPSVKKPADSPVSIGYAGNLLHPAIDHAEFKQIIRSHPGMLFHFWGANGSKGNNLAGDEISPASASFIQFLQSAPNVNLHGIKSTEELAEAYKEMDAFVVVYDSKKDMSSASNSHKIMEYLSTGKAVFCTPVEQYKEAGMLIMDKKMGKSFAAFFAREIKELEEHNHPTLQEKRKAFALRHLYRNQVHEIETFVYKL